MIRASQYVDLSSLSRKGVHNRLSGAYSFIERLETGSEFYIRTVTYTQYKIQIYCTADRKVILSAVQIFVASFRLLWKKMQLTICWRVVQLTSVSPNSEANKFPAVVQTKPLQNV